MATSNFYYENKLFIVQGSSEEWYDQHCAKDTMEHLYEQIADAFKDSKYITVSKVDRWDGNRNYSGRVFAEILYERATKDDIVRMRGEVILRGGYYSGVNIDYVIEEPEFAYAWDEQPTFKYLHVANSDMHEKIEKVLKRECQAAVCAATFSNGESIYSLV